MQNGFFVYHSCGHTLFGLRGAEGFTSFGVAQDAQEGTLTSLYRGRVVRVVPGMHAAFLDLGLARTAFLSLDDVPPAAAGQANPAVRQHDRLLVQIRKEALGNKGARVTALPTLTGQFLVYQPFRRHLAVSQKISQPERRAQLEAWLRPHQAAALAAGQPCGLVVRTAAAAPEVGEAALVAELRQLAALWQQLEAQCRADKKPALLRRGLHPALGHAKTLVGTQGSASGLQITCNDAQLAAQVAEALTPEPLPEAPAATPEVASAATAPHVVAGPQAFSGPKQADVHGFFAALKTCLGHAVKLPSGGSITIDECEAMTVIDVNSGTFVGQPGQPGRPSVAETVLALNLEAAREAARQIVARGIGGLVVVDFVDMKDPSHGHQVTAALRTGLMQDRANARTLVSPMSALGLVELTRRRTQPSLRQQATVSCPGCQGRGRLRAPWQVAQAALAAAAHALRRERADTLLLNVAREVGQLLAAAAAQELAQLEAAHQTQVLVVERERLPLERFEINHGARWGSIEAHDLRF